ncbi:MAG: hypothetical protein ACW97A_00435 [Candidatus Thorarchaeota archaeon]|jgi:DNA-binding transcriptional regulator GbsR (MarR family)
MKLDKIKQEFIRYMEEVRSGEPYAKNFIGCLISVIIEPEPISQERMVELTGYSQGSVSLTLQKLQLLMPVRTIRKIGDRKHYYTYDGSPGKFVLDLWQSRIQAQAIDIKQLEKAIDRVEEKLKETPALARFSDYLQNLQLYFKLVYELRNTGIAKFEQASELGSFENLKLLNSEMLQKGKLAEFLSQLRSISLDDADSPHKHDVPLECLHSKNDYYSSLKTNLNPLYSQSVVNQMIVIHDVFLERGVTQEQIEKSTLLPRSTISEVLTRFEKIGIIRVTKKTGTRTKLYQPAISFTDLMLGNFGQVSKHISEVMPRLSEFSSMVKKTRSKSKATKKFLEILNSLEKAYAFTRDFSNSMKVEMVIKLKEEHDRGFVFI